MTFAGIQHKFDVYIVYYQRTIYARRWNQKHTCRALTLGTFATLRHPSWPEKTTIKIPLTFLFGRIGFNNVSTKAVFHGSHPIMFKWQTIERCAVQYQVDNLRRLISFLSEKFVVLKDNITLCCCKTVFKERKGHYAQTAERQRTRKGPY